MWNSSATGITEVSSHWWRNRLLTLSHRLRKKIIDDVRDHWWRNKSLMTWIRLASDGKEWMDGRYPSFHDETSHSYSICCTECPTRPTERFVCLLVSINRRAVSRGGWPLGVSTRVYPLQLAPVAHISCQSTKLYLSSTFFSEHLFASHLRFYLPATFSAYHSLWPNVQNTSFSVLTVIISLTIQ